MILRMIIAMPIMQLLVMPLAADFEIKNINISLLITTILLIHKN
jgi:ABC-2 type transport system permease protein